MLKYEAGPGPGHEQALHVEGIDRGADLDSKSMKINDIDETS